MPHETKKESAAINTAETEKSVNTILYEQLVLLAEQSRNPNTLMDELCELTSAMCEIVRSM